MLDLVEKMFESAKSEAETVSVGDEALKKYKEPFIRQRGVLA